MSSGQGQSEGSSNVEQWIDEMVERIVDRFHPLRVILFGSRGRGDAGRESDVDLLVVLAEVGDRRKTAIEIRRALARIPLAKDIIVTTPQEIRRRGDLVGSVLYPALREGRELYAAG